jgi:glycopeptide antibiotics resistance protein
LILRLIHALHRRGLPEFLNYNVIEFSANVAMFIPLGLLVALLFGPRWWWAALFVCAGLSVSIELYQYLLLPDRYATVRDVVANSTGGAVGTVGAAIAVAWLRRPTPIRS